MFMMLFMREHTVFCTCHHQFRLCFNVVMCVAHTEHDVSRGDINARR